ncbi:MAG: cytochrome c biogenesis protein CcsA, partial [Roseomonas sp.]|nr:cytochrome c biogenesis protein CcsA [Roseomonas sp.]
MIPELGHFALILAAMLAITQSILPLWGAQRGDARLMGSAAPLAVAGFVAITISFAALIWAYVTNDMTVVNVVANSHSAKPMLFKITGVWGNHEGSLILWVMVLAGCSAAVAAFGATLPSALQARVQAVLGMILLGFLAFIIFTSNPFERIWPPPPDGQGLNPLLQDIGLAIHPPLLYVGYVGYAVTF